VSQQELLIRVARALERLGIDYMVTGAVASSFYGEPRSTHDIDLVVAVPTASIPALVRAFPEPDFYLDEESMREAVRQQGMFNLIDVDRGEKVDFWMLTEDAFDQSRFGRRQAQVVFGTTLQVSSPEDTILAKLRWAKLSSGSEKQFGDALRVYEVQFSIVDQGYLERWAAYLGVSALLADLRSEAEPL
jgi:hypothetical protein